MLPVILTAPVLFTLMLPVPVCDMPVIVSGAMLVKEITPVPVLMAFKLAIKLLLLSVVPVAELDVSNAVLIMPAPASLIVPAAIKPTLPVVAMVPAFKVMLRPAVALILPEVLPTFALTKISLLAPVAPRLTVPEPPAVTAAPIVSVPVAFKVMLPLAAVVTAPLVVKAPVLLIKILLPVSLIPVIVNGAAVLTNWMSPLVLFTALKLVTTLALLNNVPVAEFVVSKLPVINAVLASANAPLEVNETLFVPAAMLPVTFKLPVLLTLTAPVPVWEMPLIAKGAAVLIKLIAPPLFVALNVLTAFAPFKV
jgi:hypothetical protein